MTQITSQQLFDAPADIVWEVMTDSDVYAEVAPNLSSVTILEGEGEGMIRSCVDTEGNAWTESCHYWESGRGFAVTVDVETSNFHRRWFTRFDGRWELTEHSDGVQVTIQFDFETKYGLLGSLLTRYFRYKAAPLIEAIFDGWRTEIESRVAEPEHSTEGTASPTPETHTNRLYR